VLAQTSTKKAAPFRGRLDRVSQARGEMIPRNHAAEEDGAEIVCVG